MTTTHRGSCHCGAVRFEADFDLADGTSRCNCSMCGKGRFWKAIVPPDAFRLLSGADVLTRYVAGNPGIEHLFCSRCGIKTHGHARIEELGELYAVNIACLDGVTDEDLASAPVRYENGRAGAWESPRR